MFLPWYIEFSVPEPLATTGEDNHRQDSDSHDEVAVMTKKKMRSLMMMLLLMMMMRVNDD